MEGVGWEMGMQALGVCQRDARQPTESLPVTRAESREEGRVAGDEWKLPRPHHSSGETGQMIVEPTPELLITSTWEANSKSERIPPTEAGKSPILPAQIAATEFCSSSAKNDEAGNAALRRAWRGRDGVEVAKEDGDDTEQFAIRPSCCSSSSPPPSRGSRTACSRTAASSSFSSSIRESEHSRREAEREGQRRISNSQLSASSSCIDHLTSDTTAAKQDHPPSALKVSSPPSCPRLIVAYACATHTSSVLITRILLPDLITNVLLCVASPSVVALCGYCCPPIVLGTRYAMSGTELRCTTSHLRRNIRGIVMGCYGMPGTDIGYDSNPWLCDIQYD
eukprot:3361571-Rhodomonas_salina.1